MTKLFIEECNLIAADSIQIFVHTFQMFLILAMIYRNVRTSISEFSGRVMAKNYNEIYTMKSILVK